MRLICFLMLSTAKAADFVTEDQKAVEKVHGLEEQTHEIRAKLLTIQSDVNFNSEQVEKTKRYSDLVHAAWKEAISLKKNVNQLNSTLEEQQAALDDEESQRKATDGLLLDLFNSVLKILHDEADTLNGLEKKGDLIEETRNFAYSAKLEQELEKTKLLLDKQGNQLAKQKARLIDFDSFEEKVYELESQLMREIEKNDDLEQRISHDEIVFKEKRDEMLEKLNRKDQEIDGYDLTERLGQIKNDFYDNFDMLKLNLTEALVLIQERDMEVGNLTSKVENMRDSYLDTLDSYRLEIEEMSNMTRSIYYNGGEALEEVSTLVMNQTELVENNTQAIDNMFEQLGTLGQMVHELAEEQLNMTAEAPEATDEYVKELEDRLRALEYGIKVPPHKGEILLSGGDGDFGPKWESRMISIKYGASRDFENLEIPRSSHCMVKYQKEVYVVGGAGQKMGKLDTADNLWTELPDMTQYHDNGPACAVYEDRIWVCGGGAGLNVTDQCESYSHKDGWRPEPALVSAVGSTTAVVNSAGLFVVGGSDDFGPVSFVQYFDMDARVWTLWNELPHPVGISASSAVNVNDDIYLVGGNGNEANILQLDLSSQNWFNATTLEHDRIGASAVAVEDSIWVIGGAICFDDSCGDRIEIFDTKRNEVTEKRIKNHTNVNFGAAILV